MAASPSPICGIDYISVDGEILPTGGYDLVPFTDTLGISYNGTQFDHAIIYVTDEGATKSAELYTGSPIFTTLINDEDVEVYPSGHEVIWDNTNGVVWVDDTSYSYSEISMGIGIDTPTRIVMYRTYI